MNTTDKQGPKSVWIVLFSLASGFMLASGGWLLFFHQVNVGKRGVVAWLAAFVLASAILLRIHKRLLGNVRYFRYPWLVVAFFPLVGWLVMRLVGFTPPQPLFLTPTETILLRVSAEANPQSGGKVVEIHGIKNGERWENLRALDITGEYEVGEESLFLYPSGETIRWEVKAMGPLVLNFRARPDGGIVEVGTDEEKTAVDLYAEFVEEKPLMLRFSVPPGLRLISLLIYAYGIGYLLFFLPVLLLSTKASQFRKGEDGGEKVTVGHILVNLVVPLGILAVYCGSIIWINARFFTAGVTSHFMKELWLYGSVLIAGRYLLLIEFGQIRVGKWGWTDDPAQKVGSSHLFLLLLPLTPVVQYIISNRASLSAVDIAIVVIFFVVLSGLYVLVIPHLLGGIFPACKLMVFGLALIFTVMNMATLSGTFAWFERGDLRVQMGYFIFMMGVVWLLVEKVDRRVRMALVAVFLALNSGIQWMSRDNELQRKAGAVERHELEVMVGEREPILTPNIYLLVYDSYVANETMLGYGIDNSAQEDYLRENGFILYPHTYSIGATTINTMSNVLEISNDFGSSSDPRVGVSGNGAVQRALRSLGYRTYGIFQSDYMFRGIGSSYDISLPQNTRPQYLYMIASILMGEFRFDLDFADQTREDFLAAKGRIFNSIPPQPIFIYAHSSRPHHSQNSGACLPNEIELYADRLEEANQEMRQDVETILANDPGAIIVIAGDHGPYLTKNCIGTAKNYDKSEITRLDIQDRFGTFLAIRWPADDFGDYDHITVIQDLFPAIFAYLYQDPDFLELNIEPRLRDYSYRISGVNVSEGIIQGGVHDGEPLFISGD